MTDQQQHQPIVPPPELKQQMREQAPRYHINGSECREHWLIDHAAQWGYDQRGEVNEAKLRQARDQELEACCALMDEWGLDGNDLMECRRPKPSRLKEQALKAAHIELNPDRKNGALIIRTLEALPDD